MKIGFQFEYVLFFLSVYLRPQPKPKYKPKSSSIPLSQLMQEVNPAPPLQLQFEPESKPPVIEPQEEP